MQEAGIGNFDISQCKVCSPPPARPRRSSIASTPSSSGRCARPTSASASSRRAENEIVTGTPEDFAALIKSDLQMYAKLIKDAGIPTQ